MMKYKVIGKDYRDAYRDGDNMESYYERQMETFFKLFHDSEMIVKFPDGTQIADTMDIFGFIDCLAIKEGCNLVRYENGNLGFVGHYGTYENGFEIAPLTVRYYK